MQKPIEFKAATLAAMTAVIRELDNVRLSDALHTMMGGMGEFFAGEPTVIDLTQLTAVPDRVDWSGLGSLLRRYGLQPVALKGTPEHLADGARKAGLAILEDGAVRAVAADRSPPARQEAKQPPPAPPAQSVQPVTGKKTLLIERTVRSGQQIYARDSDLIILGGVSNGAEVIADGNIHCYGPLRGRALAGASGDAAARLLCTNFGPELISIAGVYRTFERGIPDNLAARPAQAVLRPKPDKTGGQTLNIEPLQLD